MYRLIKQEGAARRAEFETVHGTVQTPAFMNVATAGAIKGAVSAYDLKDLHCQVQLCNTYHLHLRPGDETVKKLGGIRKFTGWDGPVLTDSGGFRCSLWPSCGTSKRKVLPSLLMWMVTVSSWALRRVCVSSLIWDPPLLWRLMSV